MKFLLYENFGLKTKLTPSQVKFKLEDNIIPRKRNFFRVNTNTTRPYEGFIENREFEISRIIKYQNSFLPTIRGDIYSDGEGSRIQIKMKMHTAVTLLMLVWMSGVTVALIAVVGAMIGNRKFEPAVFFVLLMYALGYGTTAGGFKYESAKSKKFFAELLEADLEK